MKTKTDRTYLVEGSFNQFEIITSVLLPKETTIGYKFEKVYNISKRIDGNDVNAICFFMTKGITVLTNGNTYYQKVHKIEDLITPGTLNTIPFDSGRDKCIVTVIHNGLDLTLVQDAFTNLETDYANAQISEPYVRFAKKKDLLQPRVLGVSIIKR